VKDALSRNFNSEMEKRRVNMKKEIIGMCLAIPGDKPVGEGGKS